MLNQQSGYYRFPTVQGDRVVFVCEDDLWSVPLAGGLAIRLTSNLGAVSYPFLSPDGSQLAYVGQEEGHPEIYVMPALGGVSRRLTFLGANSRVVGWSRDGRSILFSSDTGQPFWRIHTIYQVAATGGLPDRLPLGLAHHCSFGATGGVVLGRNTSDIARWKRYRGGTTGVLWIDRQGTGMFQRLLDLPGNLASPMWIQGDTANGMSDRIYFIADHEGIGNLYSCTPDGQDLQRHTNNREYYIRNATTDGKKIVYHAGAELFYYDPVNQEEQAIEIEFHSPQVQRQRKFVEAANYLEDFDLHPEGHSTLVTCRGKSFWFGNWEGAVTQIGQPDGVRYRLTRWLNDKKRFVTISDAANSTEPNNRNENLNGSANGAANDDVNPENTVPITVSIDAPTQERLEIHSTEIAVKPERLSKLDIGRALDLSVSPVADQIMISNHRHELIWVDLVTQEYRICDRSDYRRISGFDWSPDGQWVAYGFAENEKVFVIKLWHVETGATHRITPPQFRDYNPAFDPEGKYLYFLSSREFNPVHDGHYYDYSFPKSTRPYLIALKKETPSPFVAIPKPLIDKSKSEKSENGHGKASENKKENDVENQEEPVTQIEGTPPETEPKEPTKDQKKPKFEIDLDGIEHRTIAFPVSEGIYRQIWGLKGKVLFTSYPIQGSLDEEEVGATLLQYDFDKQKQDTIAKEVNGFKLARENETLIYRSKRRLRVCTVTPLNGKLEDEPSRKTGWLDLRRLRVSVSPPQEWQQMYRETWRLQQQQFWVEDMSGVDWQRVFDRYFPLLNKISSRAEFSDLIWELQGELGTSHAYENGGDYRRPPGYRLGFLGADFAYDEPSDRYCITHIVQGDSWDEAADSPLRRLGANIQVGDRLIAINGQPLSRHCAPQELLVHQSNSEVTLTLTGTESGEIRTITVKTTGNERAARYREWVERNRQRIHEQTGDRVGYIHIPDMSAEGYAEFHRYYAAETQRQALIVDVRFNGGGNISQLLLSKLTRKPVAYRVRRWSKPARYHYDASVPGPIVTLTNEYAGSDGDIFSHTFKLMKLGTLVGKRTWGGVVGIMNGHTLVDGSRLTQPESGCWFMDVGWQVENYGTDPDVEVDITPQDWAKGEDPQLDKTIAIILEQLAQEPFNLPEFSDRPYLSLPE